MSDTKLWPAIFLDRDVVIIEDIDLLTRPDQVRLIEGVPAALKALKDAGYRLFVVTNQTVVDRGLVSEAEVMAVHNWIQHLLEKNNGRILDGFYSAVKTPDFPFLSIIVGHIG